MVLLTELQLARIRVVLQALQQGFLDAKLAEDWILQILGGPSGQLLTPNKVCPECGDLGTREDGSNCPCHY